ncbi:hypothetical protein [Lentzea sp. NPDC092896]|uniref:hypothetical protein n=1 Tax=Lentzea sp. NPDC092896 TaxID=3364127 RepID=UPI00382DFA54
MIRDVLVSPSARDGLLHMAQAATTGPPWLALALAAIGAITAIAVGFVPAVQERIKRGRSPSDGATAGTSPAVDGSVTLVREALDDARKERDEAQDEAREFAKQLAAEQVKNVRLQATVDQRDEQIRQRDEQIRQMIARFGGGTL